MSNKQGSHTLRNKTPEASIKYAKDHIESFPLMDPSYHIIPGNIRKNSLWVTKMYRLYKLECEKLHKKQLGVQNTETYSVKNAIIHCTHPRKTGVVCVTCTNTKRKADPLQRILKGYTHNPCHGNCKLES